MLKRCSRCGQSKSVDQFRKRSRSADGLQSYCKPCHTEMNRSARARDPQRYREARERYNARNGQAVQARKYDWNARNREKRRAQKEVEKAVRRGVLVKPEECEGCERPNLVLHAHHEDYGAPLDIRWLCPSCHGRRHAELRKIPTTVEA